MLEAIEWTEAVFTPELCQGSMPIVRSQGLMCPAVVELVCEALASSGRVPALDGLSDT